MNTQQILSELRAERDRLDQAIAAIESLKGGGNSAPGPRTTTAKAAVQQAGRRYISPEGRRRIAEAARRRWAAQRKGVKVAPKTAGTTGRTMSPAARKRIGEAMKKRWAERKRKAL